MSGNEISIFLKSNPFSSEIDIISEERIPFKEYYKKYVHEKYPKSYVRMYDYDVEVTNWDKVPTSDRVNIVILPSGGISQIGQALSGIGLALLPISIAFPPLIFLSFGAMFLGNALQMLPMLDALVDKFTQTADGNNPVKDSKSPSSIRGSSNSSGYGKPVPILLGEILVYPYLAAPPYTTIIDNNTKQELRELFLVGYNNIEIDETTYKIDETRLDAFQNAGVEPTADGTLPLAYSSRVVESTFRTKLEKDVEVIQTTSSNTTKLDVVLVFQSGLMRTNDQGDHKQASVSYNIQYREAGNEAASWINWINTTRTDNTVIGFYETHSLVLDNLTSSGADYNPDRQYEVKLVRTTADDRDRYRDSVSLYLLRSYTGSFESGTVNTDPILFETRQNLLLIGLTVQASNQIQGIVDKFNFIARAKIRDFNGTSWVPDTYTSNPAACLLHVLTDSNANRKPVSDSQIDFEELENWYNYCETNNLTFNAYINEEVTLASTLNDIAAAGNAAWYFADNKYKIVIDDVKDTIVQYFTPRNTWDFAGNKAFRNPPTVMNCKFISAESGYAEEVRKVYYNDIVDDSEPKEFSIYGVTNQEQMYFIAQRVLRAARYRSETFTFKCDLDGLVCTIGDRVALQHDVPLFGLHSGRIRDVYVSGAEETGFSSDEYFLYEVGKSYQVRIRLDDGTGILKDIQNPATTEDIFTNDVYFVNNEPAGTIYPENLLMFGESGSTTVDLLVQKVEPLEDFSVQVTCVEYAPEIFAATVPDPYDPKISKPGTVFGDFSAGQMYEPQTSIEEALQLGYTAVEQGQSIELNRPNSYTVTRSIAGAPSMVVMEGEVATNYYTFYINYSDGLSVYRKIYDRNVDGNRVYNNSVSSILGVNYNEIIVSKISDGYLYNYNIETAAETQLTSVAGGYPKLWGETELLYINYSDGNTLYKKTLGTLDNGIKVLDKVIQSFGTLTDDSITYTSPENNGGVIHSYNFTTLVDIPITTSIGFDSSCYTQTETVYFINNNDYVLYRTDASSTDDGERAYPFVSDISININGDIAYTSSVSGTMLLGLATAKRPSELFIPAKPADIAFTGTYDVGTNTISVVPESILEIIRVGDEIYGNNVPDTTKVQYIDPTSQEIDVDKNFTGSGINAELFLISYNTVIDQSSLSPDSISTNKIQKSAVITEKIDEQAITTEKIDIEAITTDRIKPFNITETTISDDSISTRTLQAEAVTANEILAGTITAGEIAANTITAGEIAANTLTAAEIEAGTITANEINVGDLFSQQITVGDPGYIKSDNYAPNVSGWAIDHLGNAEFNDIFARGTLSSSVYNPGDPNGWLIDENGTANFNNITAKGTMSSFNYSEGATGWLVDSAGNVEFNTGVFRDSLDAVDGTFNTLTIESGGWLKANYNTTAGSESGLIIDSSGFMQSGNFSTGVSGWKIGSDGSVEFQSGTFGGTLSAVEGTFGSTGVDSGVEISDGEIKMTDGGVFGGSSSFGTLAYRTTFGGGGFSFELPATGYGLFYAQSSYAYSGNAVLFPESSMTQIGDANSPFGNIFGTTIILNTGYNEDPIVSGSVQQRGFKFNDTTTYGQVFDRLISFFGLATPPATVSVIGYYAITSSDRRDIVALKYHSTSSILLLDNAENLIVTITNGSTSTTGASIAILGLF